MALLSLNTDYTDKDFDSMRNRLFQLIRSVFPTWTDNSVANFGNLLVELFAFTLDVSLFYQDRQSRESKITTAKLRQNLIALAKLVGYTPSNATAATADVTFTLAASLAGTLTIPAGTRVLTAAVSEPIAYQLLADLVFASGETSKTASTENSENVEVVFNSTNVSNQVFALARVPFVEVIDVTASNGSFDEAENLLSSSGSDRHFTVSVDSNERASLRFGDGVNGMIPTGTITVNYKIGGGASGRVQASTLTRLEGSFSDDFGNPAAITVNNANASSGGTDRETNEQIRQNAPASLRLLTRAIAREDFELAAETINDVARSLHVTKNEVDAIDENTGRLYLVPVGGGTASGALIAQVENLFKFDGAYPKASTYQLSVFSASYLTVNISTTVYFYAGVSKTSTRAAIVSALEAWFDPQNSDGTKNENVNFGYYIQDDDGEPSGFLPWSDLFNVIRDTSGVRKVDAGSSGLLLNGARADLAISAIEFPVLGTVTVIDAATGLPV